MASFTHRERMLMTMRGKMTDRIPFVPRLDLWWIANSLGGTLPEGHKGPKPDDIGADGCARDAVEAVELAKSLAGMPRRPVSASPATSCGGALW